MIKIKRYKNRKYYLIGRSAYATIPQLAKFIKQGEIVSVENQDGTDHTRECLVKILNSIIENSNRSKSDLVKLIRSL